MVKRLAVLCATLGACSLPGLDQLPLVSCATAPCAAGSVCGTDLFCHPAADAGPRTDGGHDGGTSDAGPPDAGPPDSGSDAGPVDAGCEPPIVGYTGSFQPRASFGLAVTQSAGVAGTVLAIAGGVDACGDERDDFQTFDTSTGQPQAQPVGLLPAEREEGVSLGLLPLPIGPTVQFGHDWLFTFGGYTSGVGGGFGNAKTVSAEDVTGEQKVPVTRTPMANAHAWAALAALPVVAAPDAGDVLFLVVGGAEAFRGSNVTSAVEVYDPLAGNSGAAYEAPGLPTARSHLGGAVAPDGYFYAIGGQDDGGAPLDVVERMNAAAACLNGLPAGSGSTTLQLVVDDAGAAPGCGWDASVPLPTARTDLAVTRGPDGLIYAIGGVLPDGGVTGVVEAFDSAAGAWRQRPPLNVPRHAAGAATTSAGIVWVLGGIGTDGRILADVEFYDPAEDAGWQLVPGQ